MRKGLSDIVTAVLLILLILVLIGIMWAFLRPVLSDTADETQSAVSCINAELSPIKCAYGESNTIVTIERTTDSAAITSFEVLFIGANQEQATQSFDTRLYADHIGQNIPAPLESTTYIIPTPENTNPPQKIRIAARVGTNKELCAPSAIEVGCAPNVSPVCGDTNHDGGVDGSDQDLFWIAWEAGDLCADTNGDLVISGLDIEAFYEYWSGGGTNSCPCTALCNAYC